MKGGDSRHKNVLEGGEIVSMLCGTAEQLQSTVAYYTFHSKQQKSLRVPNTEIFQRYGHICFYLIITHCLNVQVIILYSINIYKLYPNFKKYILNSKTVFLLLIKKQEQKILKIFIKIIQE